MVWLEKYAFLSTNFLATVRALPPAYPTSSGYYQLLPSLDSRRESPLFSHPPEGHCHYGSLAADTGMGQKLPCRSSSLYQQVITGHKQYDLLYHDREIEAQHSNPTPNQGGAHPTAATAEGAGAAAGMPPGDRLPSADRVWQES